MLRILIFLTLFIGVLGASELETFNIVSYTKLEEFFYTQYVLILSVFTYIVFDVIGIHLTFLIIAVLMFLWKFFNKLFTLQLDQLLTFIWTTPFNNIFVKYIVYLFVVYMPLEPVKVDLWKIQQASEEHGYYVKDLKSFDGSSTSLDINKFLDYVGVKNDIKIENKAPYITVAPFNFFYSVLYGLPYGEKISEGEEVKQNAGVFPLSLVGMIDDYFGFKTIKKGFSSFIYEPSSIIDNSINFMPTLTKTTNDKETTRKVLSDKLTTLNNNLNFFTKPKETFNIKKDDLLFYEYIDFLNSKTKDFKEYSNLFMGGETEEKIKLLEEQKETFNNYLETIKNKFRPSASIINKDFVHIKSSAFSAIYNKVLTALGVEKIQNETIKNSLNIDEKFNSTFHKVELVNDTFKEDLLNKFVLNEAGENKSYTKEELIELKAYFLSLNYKNVSVVKNFSLIEYHNLKPKEGTEYDNYFNEKNIFLQKLFLVNRNLYKNKVSKTLKKVKNESLELKPLQLREDVLIDIFTIIPGDYKAVSEVVYKIVSKLEKIDKEAYKIVINNLKQLTKDKVSETDIYNIVKIKNDILKIAYKKQMEQKQYLEDNKFLNGVLNNYYNNLNENFDLRNEMLDYLTNLDKYKAGATTEEPNLRLYPSKAYLTMTYNPNALLDDFKVFGDTNIEKSFIDDLMNKTVKEINQKNNLDLVVPLSFTQHHLYTNELNKDITNYKFFKFHTENINLNNTFNNFNELVFEEISQIMEKQDPYKIYNITITNGENFYKQSEKKALLDYLSLSTSLEVVKNVVSDVNNFQIQFIDTEPTTKDFNIYTANKDWDKYKLTYNRLMPNREDNTAIIRTHLADLLYSHNALYQLLKSYKDSPTGLEIIEEAGTSLTGIIHAIYNDIKKNNTEPLIKGHLNNILQKKLKWLYRFPLEGNYRTKETEEKTSLTGFETLTAGALTIFMMDFDSTVIKMGTLGIILNGKMNDTEVAGEKKSNGIIDKINNIVDKATDPTGALTEQGIKLISEIFLIVLTIIIFVFIFKIFFKYFSILKDFLLLLLSIPFDLVINLLKADNLIEFFLEIEKKLKDIIIKGSTVFGFYAVLIIGALSINGVLEFIFINDYETNFMQGDAPNYDAVMDAVGYLSFIAILGWYVLSSLIYKMFSLEATKETQIVNNASNQIQKVPNKLEDAGESAKDRAARISKNVNDYAKKMREEKGKAIKNPFRKDKTTF